MHITPTSDISQPFKSAGFDARCQITDTKSERNNMRNRVASKGKGIVEKKLLLSYRYANPPGHKVWGKRIVWVLYEQHMWKY